MKKTYLQCGYEDSCKNKECLKCPRRTKLSLSLTHAEMTAIEDCAMCDLEAHKSEKPKEFELMQNIMYRVMMKVFRGEEKSEKSKKSHKH